MRAWRKHDWYRNPRTQTYLNRPTHREIKERLAQHILKMLTDPPSPNVVEEWRIADTVLSVRVNLREANFMPATRGRKGLRVPSYHASNRITHCLSTNHATTRV